MEYSHNNRYRKMRQISLFLFILSFSLLLSGCTLNGERKVIKSRNSKTYSCEPASFRTERLAEWENLRYGMFIAFGMSTFTLDEYDKGNLPSSTYAPKDLDVRQWIITAKQAGMKYAVLSAKHVAGHCLWDSEGYDYDVATSKDKTDVVAEFMAACKTEGIKPGIYYCVLDRHNEENKDISFERPISDKYFSLIKHHLTELHTRYPDIYEQWIDIPTKLTSQQRWELYLLVKKLNPECFVLMNQGYKNAVAVPQESWPTDLLNCERNMPPSTGHNSIKFMDDKTYYLPVEVCDTIGSRWYWAPNDPPKSIELLYQYYLACVQRHANLLLCVPVDNTGKIPKEYVDALKKLKEVIDNPSVVSNTEVPVSFKCVARCSNIRENNFGRFSPFGAVDGDMQTRWATDDNLSQYWIEIDLGDIIIFDRVRIDEFENNILEFEMLYKKDKRWQPFLNGTTIGKQWTKIFEPIAAQHVRLNILSAKKGPSIKELQLYSPARK